MVFVGITLGTGCSSPLRVDVRMMGDFNFITFDPEEVTAFSPFTLSCSDSDITDLLGIRCCPCSLLRLLCNFSFKCALICALNSDRSVYCFPHIVQIDGCSWDGREEEEGNDDEDRAKEEDDSASEHDEAAGDAAIAGEVGDEEDEDSADDCSAFAKLIVPAVFTDVTVVPSIVSGTASTCLLALRLLAMDLAEEALTTK